MPSENPYAKPRTKKSDSHSSKPNTTGYRDDEQYPRGVHLTRRQANLFPFMKATMYKGLTQHRRKKIDGGRRRTRRHTRRR
jgi:hypothetical protein